VGGMAEVRCECGFTDDSLDMGMGRSGVARTSVSCRTCGVIHSIVTEDLFGAAGAADGEPCTVRSVADGCPECGGKVSAITARGGPCPRCGRRLRIEFVGLSD
jgi:hypothetical protein